MESKDRRKLGNIIDNANRSEISRVTGIHLSHVSKVLSGNRRPSSANLRKIADVLSVSMDDLFDYLMWKRDNGEDRRRNRAA